MHFVQEPGARGEDVPLTLFSNVMARNISVVHNAGYYYVQHEDSAMHQFKGFRKYRFPYLTMTDMLEQVASCATSNSRSFFEYGVIKAFAQFLWVFSAGATGEELKKLCKYTAGTQRKYLSQTTRELLHINRHAVDFTFTQKAAVTLTVLCIKMNVLYPVVRFRALFR